MRKGNYVFIGIAVFFISIHIIAIPARNFNLEDLLGHLFLFSFLPFVIYHIIVWYREKKQGIDEKK